MLLTLGHERVPASKKDIDQTCTDPVKESRNVVLDTALKCAPQRFVDSTRAHFSLCWYT